MHKGFIEEFLAALAWLTAGTALIAAAGLDLAVEGHFHLPGSGWIHAEENPWRFLYHYGTIPAYALAALALVALLAGYRYPPALPYRKHALFCLLLLMLGPGLLVNAVFKDHWGRPRPRQLQLFGGDRPFHQVWERGEGGQGRSFPSGHASAAFYLIAPYFLLRRRSPRRSRLFLAGGCAYGVLMGTARMVQGGHFLSDVLWAGGMVYLAGVALYHLLGLAEDALPAAKEPLAG